jgi:hypothetical protein
LLDGARLARAEDNRAAALAVLRAGNKLLDAGQAQAALAKFQEAYRLTGSPKLHFNFGQAYRALPGREVEAFTSFQHFLDEAQDAAPETRAEAERQRSELRRVLGFLAIATAPAGGTIFVDDVERGVAPLSVAVRAGVHDVRAQLSGYLPSAPDPVTLAPGQEAKKRITLQPRAVVLAPVVPSASPSHPPATIDLAAPPPEPTPAAPIYRRWWFWTGVAGAAVLAVTGALVATRGSGTVVHMCSSASRPSTGICDSLP